MEKSRIRLLRYPDVSVENVFEKEAELLQLHQANQLEQSLILWRTSTPTLVLPAGRKWPKTESLINELSAMGWQLFSRKTGGAPVPQTANVLNLSHLYNWSDSKPYSIISAYENLCVVLTHFLASYGIKSHIHATPGSYCDGDYNLNINGKKIIGTAQRVVIKKGGGHVVLAQACILIDAVLETLISSVNLCYEHSAMQERVKASVHTSLFEHIIERPSTEALFTRIQHAFVDSKLV